MKLLRRNFLHLAAGATAFPTVSRIAWADAYPTRPVTMIVPFAAGGPTDAVGRVLAEHMRGALGQTVIVENTAGAGGTIGVGRVARATPDGYTLGLGIWSTHVVNGAMYALPYDLIKDFEPVALIATQPFLIVAKKSVPANNLVELIAWLKANANKASQGNSGIGTPSHVGGILFQNAIGVHLTMVPYRGAGQSMQDLVAGQIDMMLDTPALSLPQLRGGTIKAYGVTATSRLSAMPDIATLDEQGLSGFVVDTWYGLWAPKGTPKAALDALNRALQAATADATFGARVADLGSVPASAAQAKPDVLRAFLKSEIDTWGTVIKQAGIVPE